jgi:hypothetical protein
MCGDRSEAKRENLIEDINIWEVSKGGHEPVTLAAMHDHRR